MILMAPFQLSVVYNFVIYCISIAGQGSRATQDSSLFYMNRLCDTKRGINTCSFSPEAKAGLLLASLLHFTND